MLGNLLWTLSHFLLNILAQLFPPCQRSIQKMTVSGGHNETADACRHIVTVQISHNDRKWGLLMGSRRCTDPVAVMQCTAAINSSVVVTTKRSEVRPVVIDRRDNTYLRTRNGGGDGRKVLCWTR